MAIARPRTGRGVTSRIPASMTPVLPSWRPIRSIDGATCHGSRLERHRAEHDGLDERAPDDDGLAAVLVGPDAPQRHQRCTDDEDEGAEEADEREPIALRDAASRSRYSGRNENTWLTPSPSTMEVSQNTTRRARQSCPRTTRWTGPPVPRCVPSGGTGTGSPDAGAACDTPWGPAGVVARGAFVGRVTGANCTPRDKADAELPTSPRTVDGPRHVSRPARPSDPLRPSSRSVGRAEVRRWPGS